MTLIFHLIYLILLTLTSEINGFHVVPLSYSLLPENQETTVDLSRKIEKRFYLHISNELSPFFMYITPCGAPVHWQLFSMDKELSMNDEFETISDISTPLDQSEKFRLIAGEEDRKRMTFFAHRLPRKVLLVIRSTSGPATVRIFFSPSLFRIEDQYPPLPHDTRLAISRIDEFSTRITWKIATQVKNGENGRYRTCTVISRRDPEKSSTCAHVEEGVESVKCVPGSNNSVVVENLPKNAPVFATIFIRDHKKGTISTYETQILGQLPEKATRKVPRNVPRKPKKSTPKPLADGQLSHLELDGKKGSFVNLRFFVPAGPGNSTQSAMLIVHACDGLVRINLFRNGKTLKKSEPFSGFRRFVVTNVRNGNLRFQIVNDDDTPKSVRVWASTDHSNSPYPNLPDDTSVKIVGRTCSSTAIQWVKAHDAHVKYCVYHRKEASNFLEQLVSLADNLCEGGLSSSTLVGCYTQSSAEDESLIETTVSGLQPGSTYRLDLLAIPMNRPDAQPLPYRTVWVRTNRNCGF